MMRLHRICQRGLIMAWLMAATCLLSEITHAAQTATLTPLRLAYSAITVNQAIPWIALEAGHFRAHGLDVEVIHASSITPLQGLRAG